MTADTPPADPAPVGVVGAGLMGHGICQLLAAAGHPVALHDPDPDALDSAPDRIANATRLLGQDPEAVLGRVRLERRLEDVAAGAALVVEDGPERLEVKQEIFRRLERAAAPTTILATNTSALRVGRVGAGLAHPDRVLGTHFWNPPHLVALVEVVEGPATSADTLARTMALLEAAGKVPVHVRRDVPGFIGNRLQHALKREAIALVADGVCDAASVDRVVKEGFGPRLAVLGPLEQSDLVGLDLTLAIHRTLLPDLDQLPRPHPLLERLVAEGRTGMAAGEGFRSWTPATAQATRRRLDAFLAQRARATADAHN